MKFAACAFLVCLVAFAAHAAVPNQTAIDTFTKALSGGAKVDLSKLAIDTLPNEMPIFSPFKVAAATTASAGDVILTVPAALQLTEKNMDPTLRSGLMVLLETSVPELKVDLENPDLIAPLPLVYSLVAEQKKGKKSKWWPWIEALPSTPADMANSVGLFASKEEMNCMDPRGQQLVELWRHQRSLFINASKALCETQLSTDAFTAPGDDADAGADGDDAEKRQAKMDGLKKNAELVKKFSCQVAPDDIEWALGLVLSRGMTFMDAPAMFPVVDNMPFSLAPTVRPGPVDKGDEATGRPATVSFVATKDLAAGQRLTFRSDSRDDIEILLRQGFFPSQPDQQFLEGAPTVFDYGNTVKTQLQNAAAGAGGPDAPLDDVAQQLYDLMVNGEGHCGTSAKANRLTKEGTFDEAMMRCTELFVVVMAEVERMRFKNHPNKFPDGAPVSFSNTKPAEYRYNEPVIRMSAIQVLLEHAMVGIDDIETLAKEPSCNAEVVYNRGIEQLRAEVKDGTAGTSTEEQEIFKAMSEDEREEYIASIAVVLKNDLRRLGELRKYNAAHLLLWKGFEQALHARMDELSAQAEQAGFGSGPGYGEL